MYDFVSKSLSDMHPTETEHHTHTSMCPPRKYCIEYQNTEKFHSLILNSKETLSFLEKRDEWSMITIDYDLKEKGIAKKNLHTIEDIKKVVKDAITLLRKNNSQDLIKFSCTHFYKDPYISDEYIKHGFHLQFLLLCSDKSSRERFISDLRKIHPNIDSGSNNYWFMYKCGKNKSKQPYQTKYTFIPNSNNDLTMVDTFKFTDKYMDSKNPVTNFSVVNANNSNTILYNYKNELKEVKPQKKFVYVDIPEKDHNGIYEKVYNYLNKDFELSEISGSFITCKRVKRGKCMISDKVHTNRNAYILIKEDKSIHFGCFNKQCNDGKPVCVYKKAVKLIASKPKMSRQSFYI
jgi:hypothetical protein